MRWWTTCVLLIALLAGGASAWAQGEGDPSAEATTEQAAPPPQNPVPEELRDPRELPERFMQAFEAYARGGAAERLRPFLPRRDREALDDAWVGTAEKLGEVLQACKLSGRVSRPYAPDPDLTRIDWSVRDENWKPLELPLDRDEEGAWRFAPEAVDNAVERHVELNPDQYLLRRLFSRFGDDRLIENSLLGLRYYQWASLFTLIFAGVLVDFIVRFIVAMVSRRYLRRDEDQMSDTDARALIRKSARPFGMVAGGVLVYLALPLLELPAQVDGVLRLAAKVFAMIAGQWAAFRVVDLVGEWFNRRAVKTASKIDDLLIPLIRKALKVFLLAFGLIFIAESLDLPVTSLLAGFGLAGAAVAFASKDTVENLFGSIAVILDRPFHQGDWIVVGGVEGTVEELGFRSTRVRTFYNSLVTVPNSTLVRATVDNYGRRRYRRFKTVLSVTYDTPPDKIEAFCEGIRELIRRGEYTRKDFFEVHLNAFAPASLDVLVYMFFRVPDWSVELRERHRFCLDIIRLANELGVEFAFPTQTIHMAGDGIAEPPDRTTEDDAMDMGRGAAMSVLRGAKKKST